MSLDYVVCEGLCLGTRGEGRGARGEGRDELGLRCLRGALVRDEGRVELGLRCPRGARG
jgi:hypothetical protein